MINEELEAELNAIIEDGGTADKSTEKTVKEKLVARLKSPVVILAILSIIGLIAGDIGLFAKLNIDGTTWEALTRIIVYIITGYAAVNNPDNKGEF